MKCQRCGRKNPANADRCMYCNSPLYSGRNNMNGRQSGGNDSYDTLIIAAIIVLSIIFMTVVGVFLYQNYTPNGFSFTGGVAGGGGSGKGGSHTLPPPASDGKTGTFTLEVSRSELKKNSADNTVYFFAKPNKVVDAVNLIDDEGNFIAEMKDDGDYSKSGDDVLHDGVYTAKVPINVSYEHAFYCNAVISGAKSNDQKITVFSGFKRADMRAINDVNVSLEAMRGSSEYKQLSVDGRSEKALELLNLLSEKGLVIGDKTFYDKNNNTITFYYASGILGMERLENLDPVYAGGGDSLLPKKSGYGKVNLAGGGTRIAAGLGNATILYALGDPADKNWRYHYAFCEHLRNEWTSLGLRTVLEPDVTVNTLKNFKNKSLVYVAAHGTCSTFKYMYDQKYWFVFKADTNSTIITAPCVFLKEKPSNAKNNEYLTDLKSGRVIIANGEYAVLPAFFDRYYDSDDLDGSIFFWGSCQFLGRDGVLNEEWTNVLNSKSIGAFVGFHNSCYIPYQFDLLEEFVPALINGNNVGNALNLATQKYGANDVQWYNGEHTGDWWTKFQKFFDGGNHPHSGASTPMIRGNDLTVLVNDSLQNGGFEENSFILKGWKKTGDVRLVPSALGVVPRSGNRMAVLTTGIGSEKYEYESSSAGSSLYQTVFLESDAKSLSFSYNFISEEPETFNSRRKIYDKFYVEILNSRGETVKTLLYNDTSYMKWIPISGTPFWYTEWQNVEFDISSFHDQIVTVKFTVQDAGDSSLDTIVAIDDVILN